MARKNPKVPPLEAAGVLGHKEMVEAVFALWNPKSGPEPTALMKSSESFCGSKSWCWGVRPCRDLESTTVRLPADTL